MMKNMRLLSSVFRSIEDLSKDVKNIEEEEEEGPCTSYSHQEEDKHEGHLDYQILSDYLVEYRSQPRAFKETLYFPHFIQLKEEKRPCREEKSKAIGFCCPPLMGHLQQELG